MTNLLNIYIYIYIYMHIVNFYFLLQQNWNALVFSVKEYNNEWPKVQYNQYCTLHSHCGYYVR